MDIGNGIPSHFDAGETVQYTVTIPGFTPGDGWALRLYLNGGSPAAPAAIHSDAVADPDDESNSRWLITLLATESAPLSAGRYGFLHRITDGAVAHDVETGSVTVGLNLATAAAGATLSFEEKTLAGVRTKIAERVALDQYSYNLLGRGAQREELAQLQRLEADLVARIASQRRGGAPRESTRYSFRLPCILPVWPAA